MNPKTAKTLAKTLLPEAKLWIRRSSTNLDSEIEQTVAACLMDLGVVGIKKIDEEDPLIQQAAKLYLKAQFGSDGKAERWEMFYERLKSALALSGEYTMEASDG